MCCVHFIQIVLNAVLNHWMVTRNDNEYTHEFSTDHLKIEIPLDRLQKDITYSYIRHNR
jgi:hypothetical protein